MAGGGAHLGISRHKAVHVVVDLLKHKASVHEGEAALSGKDKQTISALPNSPGP